MLRIAKVRPGGQGYYLDVAAGTGTGVEPPGRWSGTAAGRLGLTGDVDRAGLGRLLAGVNPDGGRALSESHDRVKVAAFDLTFCAPKSVSLLAALGDAELSAGVVAGHRHAVDAAVGYLERRGAAVRRAGPGGRVPVPVEGIAAAGFLHQVSRALDPHLHSHVVVANLGSADGRWTALDGRGLYAHRAAADALYHAHLRHQLSCRFGVAWGLPAGGRADVEGIGPEVRGEFSRRAAAIAARASALGVTSHRGREVAAVVTRPARDVRVGADQLRSHWRNRARRLGLGPSRLDAVLGRVPAPGLELPAGIDGEVIGTLVAAGRSPARRDVVRAHAAMSKAGAEVAVIEEAADRLLAARVGEQRRPGCPRTPPGVAEPRHDLARFAELGLGAVDRGGPSEPAQLEEPDSVGRAGRSGRDATEHDRLAELLVARGLRPGVERTRGRGRPRSGPELDLGL